MKTIYVRTQSKREKVNIPSRLPVNAIDGILNKQYGEHGWIVWSYKKV
jgi:hypothetical protein